MRRHRPLAALSFLALAASLGLARPTVSAEDGGPSNLPPPTSRRIQGPVPGGAVSLPANPGAAAPMPSSPAPVRREVTGTGILGVRTAENLPLTGGGTAVQLIVHFRVVRDDGRQFYVNALFFDRATGQAIASRRPAFADTGTGALYVISHPAVHSGGDREYEVTLQVPYDAFPAPAAGGSTSVETRVSLFRRALGGGMDESMDWTTAAFGVHGPAGAAPAPSSGSGFPAPASGGFPAPSGGAAPAVVVSEPQRPSYPPPAAASPVAAPMAGATGRTGIVSVTKHHNQAYPDGRLGLVLDVTYRVVGDQGRSFYLHAVFHDRATGQAVTSVRPQFGDRTTGALYVLTQPALHSAIDNTYRTQLWVPYDAFPRPAAGTAANIEARLSLFRRDLGSGADASMDVSAVAFQVEG